MIIDTYRDSLVIRNYQPSSLYRNVRFAIRFLDYVKDIHAITTEKIENYLIGLIQDGKSIKTVKNHRAGIKVFCDFLACRGYLDENPVLKIPSMDMPEEIPVCLSDEEIRQAGQIGKQVNLECEISLALNTGLRMEELRQLKWADIDLDRKQLTVTKSKGKRPRTVPLNESVRDQLYKQLNQYGHLIFVFPGGKVGGHIKSNWVQPTMRGTCWWGKRSVKVLQREFPTLQNLPSGRTGRGWHIFRHTFATQCIKADIDVVKLRDWMGHRKIETTLRYIHVARHYDPDIERLGKSN